MRRRGQWRSLKRFAIWQVAHGKWRLIDNGLESLHNASLEAEERIHTTSSNLNFAVARYIHRALLERGASDRGVAVSTQDMKAAYRQVPVHPEDARLELEHFPAGWMLLLERGRGPHPEAGHTMHNARVAFPRIQSDVLYRICGLPSIHA